MARLTIKNKEIIIKVEGGRKLLTAKSEIVIPLENVVSASAQPITWSDVPSMFDFNKGTNLPGFYFGGTFIQDGNKVFYDLARKEDALTITLKDETFKQLIVGVNNPTEVAGQIQTVLQN